MAPTVEEVEADVQAALGDDWLLKLAERIGAKAGASAVFAEPVEREGVTVIPVARLRWGIGGGRGRNRGQAGEGLGAGGGVQAAPLGFIEIKDGAATYKRVHDPLRLAVAMLLMPLSSALAVVAVIVTLTLMARTLRNLFRLPRLLPLRRARILCGGTVAACVYVVRRVLAYRSYAQVRS